MKHLLIILSILLVPISAFGWDWKVRYDMRKSDGSFENVTLSVPIVEGTWELPNQVGSWKCSVDRNDYVSYTSASLHCRLKDHTTPLTSFIRCNKRNTKTNYLGVDYPSVSKEIPNTRILLSCE